MRATDWGGKPPRDEDEARRLILQGALRCVEKFGLNKLNIKRVAEEVGATRQTVYRYFPSAEDLLTAVSFAVGGELLNGMQQHISHFHDFEQKMLQSVLFLARQIPDDDFLRQYFSAQTASGDKLAQVFQPAPLEFSFRAIKSLYSDEKISAAEETWLRGLAEHALRTVLMLILAPSEQTRSDRDRLQYLNLWFKPLLQPPR